MFLVSDKIRQTSDAGLRGPDPNILGKLAMADIFLIALYVVIVKGIALARIEIAWGLYLFTACVLASILLSFATAKRHKS